MFEGSSGLTDRVFNETSAIGIPFRLNVGQETVNVTVCRLNSTSLCDSIIAGLCIYTVIIELIVN